MTVGFSFWLKQHACVSTCNGAWTMGSMPVFKKPVFKVKKQTFIRTKFIETLWPSMTHVFVSSHLSWVCQKRSAVAFRLSTTIGAWCFFSQLTSHERNSRSRDPRQFVGSINRAHLYPRLYRPVAWNRMSQSFGIKRLRDWADKKPLWNGSYVYIDDDSLTRE